MAIGGDRGRDSWWERRQLFKRRNAAFKSKMRERRRRRDQCLQALGLLQLVEKKEDSNSTTTTSPLQPLDPVLERQVMECLLSPVDLPYDVIQLLGKTGIKPPRAAVMMVLDKLSCQGLVTLHVGGGGLIVGFVELDKISCIAEAIGITGQSDTLQTNNFKSVDEEIEWLVNTPSVRDRESHRVGSEIQELLSAKSVKEQLMLEKFKTAGGSQLREFCPHKTRDDCRRLSSAGRSCNKLHFRKIIHNHTDESLGDCSFLNTCFHVDTCKFVHYEVESVQEPPGGRPRPTKPQSYQPSSGARLGLPQWINCDLRFFDMSILGKFSVVMADPPWDIHMELPYGTMSDDEMRQLNIPALQDNGYIFLWVTGRAMELGRECLTLWGYERINELIWVKTNQLQRLIRTGRTGHWINHGKEHCLVGVKGNPVGFNVGIDCDVVVAEVRATSHKPDEVYGLIERLSPGTRKIELFGRSHNCQPNWLTLGNQLEGVVLYDDDLRNTFYKRYPREEMAMMPPPTPSTR